jgi:hypothetical protein
MLGSVDILTEPDKKGYWHHFSIMPQPSTQMLPADYRLLTFGASYLVHDSQ